MLEGSVPGVFAARDVRHGSVKRVASAVGEGSVAVMFIHRYLTDSCTDQAGAVIGRNTRRERSIGRPGLLTQIAGGK